MARLLLIGTEILLIIFVNESGKILTTIIFKQPLRCTNSAFCFFSKGSVKFILSLIFRQFITPLGEPCKNSILCLIYSA